MAAFGDEFQNIFVVQRGLLLRLGNPGLAEWLEPCEIIGGDHIIGQQRAVELERGLGVGVERARGGQSFDALKRRDGRVRLRNRRRRPRLRVKWRGGPARFALRACCATGRGNSATGSACSTATGTVFDNTSDETRFVVFCGCCFRPGGVPLYQHQRGNDFVWLWRVGFLLPSSATCFVECACECF